MSESDLVSRLAPWLCSLVGMWCLSPGSQLTLYLGTRLVHPFRHYSLRVLDGLACMRHVIQTIRPRTRAVSEWIRRSEVQLWTGKRPCGVHVLLDSGSRVWPWWWTYRQFHLDILSLLHVSYLRSQGWFSRNSWRLQVHRQLPCYDFSQPCE